MDKAKRARKAETPIQPSLGLRLCAPYFYPTAIVRPAKGVVVEVSDLKTIATQNLKPHLRSARSPKTFSGNIEDRGCDPFSQIQPRAPVEPKVQSLLLSGVPPAARSGTAGLPAARAAVAVSIRRKLVVVVRRALDRLASMIRLLLRHWSSYGRRGVQDPSLNLQDKILNGSPELLLVVSPDILPLVLANGQSPRRLTIDRRPRSGRALPVCGH